MELQERLNWLEGIDGIYKEVTHMPHELHTLGLHLIRAYVWPLYDMAD